MKIHFEPNLQYQKDAIDSVIRLFEGAPYIKPADSVFAEVSGNVLKIQKDKVFENHDVIINENQITDSHQNPGEMDFSIEMETGTGKTYVYLRTIIELHKTYGLNKFIIVVPSIAVKEGVMKTLEMTGEHFKNLYNVNADYFEYDSKKATRVRHFAFSTNLQIMVTNVQAFNTDDRIINQVRDTNNGQKLVDLIKATSPVIVMDEPQEGMDSANMKKRFASLNPLFKLRYSATHRKMVNLVYQLTPYDAYNQNLVKKIEVFSIFEGNTQSNVMIDFEDVKFDASKPPQAKLNIAFKLADGSFKSKSAYFKDGDNLENKTKNSVYRGWEISRIHKDPIDGTSKVIFSNGKALIKGTKFGSDKESIFREQIKWTIRKHFAKKEKYKDIGLKVLTLFFIDKVANYVEEEGIIRKLFKEIYPKEYKAKYGAEPAKVSEVHNGYFAKTTKGEYTDNENSMKKNSEIYNTIMRDKEKLLSFEEPLEFVFSHSALGVGWDNPNVFNICTLNESESVIKKRQEIGRGLRIPVDQEGKRYRDADGLTHEERVNKLTVIANQSYASFVDGYQTELISEYGENVKIPKPVNARKEPMQVKLRKEVLESDDFKNLWKQISKKTTYKVSFREEELVNKCVEALDAINVEGQTIHMVGMGISEISQDEGVSSEYLGSGQTISKATFSSIDIADDLSEETALSIGTVLKILNGMQNKESIQKNPILFLSEAVKAIKNILDSEMVVRIDYQTTGESFDLSEFKEVIPAYEDTYIPVSDKGLYDHVIFDSEVEKEFAQDIDNEDRIRSFVKLPDWYTIDTPIGKYNPDFALVVEKIALADGDKTSYYFVIETKGTDDINKLKKSEILKIKCALRHFKAVGLNEYFAPVKNFTNLSTIAEKQVGEKLL